MFTTEERKTRSAARVAARKAEKERQAIEAERNQKHVHQITITIEWKHSRTWGMNPNARARVQFQDGSWETREGFRASGCGYDKRSTVVAEIFNAFLKYKFYEGRKGEYRLNGEKTTVPYGFNDGDHKYYGHGIGINSYFEIAKFIGGELVDVAHGERFEVYTYTEPQEPEVLQ